eukprot:15334604-Alexandrium_andersonii.AAC.1
MGSGSFVLRVRCRKLYCFRGLTYLWGPHPPGYVSPEIQLTPLPVQTLLGTTCRLQRIRIT